MSSFRSAKASSGSIIFTHNNETEKEDVNSVFTPHSKETDVRISNTQNSARCLAVFEFSALNVGPNV